MRSSGTEHSQPHKSYEQKQICADVFRCAQLTDAKQYGHEAPILNASKLMRYVLNVAIAVERTSIQVRVLASVAAYFCMTCD